MSRHSLSFLFILSFLALLECSAVVVVASVLPRGVGATTSSDNNTDTIQNIVSTDGNEDTTGLPTSTMQAIIVVLVIFLVFLLSLYLFRKHRFSEIARWIATLRRRSQPRNPTHQSPFRRGSNSMVNLTYDPPSYPRSAFIIPRPGTDKFDDR